MSLHPFSHPWEVQQLKDGTSVKLSHRDLDVQTLSILADELFELAQVSGQPRLYLDFGKVNLMTSVAIGKLFVLDRRLREAGGRLLVCNLSPALQEVFQAVKWPSDSTAE